MDEKDILFPIIAFSTSQEKYGLIFINIIITKSSWLCVIKLYFPFFSIIKRINDKNRKVYK